MTTPIPTRDVAKRLQISVPSVTRLVRDGALEPVAKAPGVRGAYLFDPADVDALLSERAR